MKGTKANARACRGLSGIGHLSVAHRPCAPRLPRHRVWMPGVAFVFLAGCIQYVSPPTQPTAAQRLAEVERLYGDTRSLYFQVYVTEANGTGKSARGVPVGELRASFAALRERTNERLSALDSARYREEDRRAFSTMRATLTQDDAVEDDALSNNQASDCQYDVTALANSGQATLSTRMYTCYAAAQSTVVTPSDTTDRLTVLSRLGTDTSQARRRALFLSLRPVWESVNGTNAPGSPYRRLVALSAERWRREGSQIDQAAKSLGLVPAATESLLVTVLNAWRRQLPAGLLEPWDWYYANSATSRRLSPRVPLRELERINEAYYSAFGASPRALAVHYDLVPRVGKTPVAFTQFGGLPRRTPSGPRGAEPWVFATYREGGLGNLVEMLHETGHAVHIAAIDTRPAFADWPDSDPFTEALADVPALEVYETRWQVKYLGDSVGTAESLREKYGSMMMDVAWALFELRMHRDPSLDPNKVWSDLTSRYLGIAPHPEWSWWAMRGQLVNGPGYMMNYALGAMLVADMRARIAERKGGFLAGGPKLYEWLSDELYRHGRSTSSREVIERFLGRPMGPESIVNDINRIPPPVAGR